MLHGEHRPGTPETGLHFVRDQDDSVRVAKLAQRPHERRRYGVKAAFTLDGLDDDGGDTGRLDIRLEQEIEILERVFH